MDNQRYFVYGKSSCSYCVSAKHILVSLNKDFVFYDFEEDPEFLDYTKKFYRYPTVPIIVKNDKETGLCSLIGGFGEFSQLLGVSVNEA
mgnify:CR=1 FL=1